MLINDSIMVSPKWIQMWLSKMACYASSLIRQVPRVRNWLSPRYPMCDVKISVKYRQIFSHVISSVCCLTSVSPTLSPSLSVSHTHNMRKLTDWIHFVTQWMTHEFESLQWKQHILLISGTRIYPHSKPLSVSCWMEAQPSGIPDSRHHSHISPLDQSEWSNYWVIWKCAWLYPKSAPCDNNQVSPP